MNRETVNIFENNSYIVSINPRKNEVIVSDIDEHSYYKIDSDKYEDLFKDENFKFTTKIKDNIILFMFVILFISSVSIYYFFNVKYKIIDKDFLYATMILLINIPIT